MQYTSNILKWKRETERRGQTECINVSRKNKEYSDICKQFNKPKIRTCMIGRTWWGYDETQNYKIMQGWGQMWKGFVQVKCF